MSRPARIRPPTSLIIGRVFHPESNREVLTLECGHELVQARRPTPRKRVYCPKCPA